MNYKNNNFYIEKIKADNEKANKMENRVFMKKLAETCFLHIKTSFFHEKGKIRYSSWLLIAIVGLPNGARGGPWGPWAPQGHPMVPIGPR